MAPLVPHWPQPSHPDVQEVIFSSNPEDYSSKAISRVNLPPNASKFLFGKLVVFLN